MICGGTALPRGFDAITEAPIAAQTDVQRVIKQASFIKRRGGDCVFPTVACDLHPFVVAAFDVTTVRATGHRTA